MQTNEINEEKIREIVNSILSRREFNNDKTESPLLEAIGRIWETIQDWIKELFQRRTQNREVQFNPNLYNSSLQTILKILLILITAVLVIVLIRLIIRGYTST